MTNDPILIVDVDPDKDLTTAPPIPGSAADILARTLYGEARGEPVRGIEAVAAVVMNRVRIAQRHGGFWWGNSVEGVCRRPYQFSCWNQDDPNLPKLTAVDMRDRRFRVCVRIAQRAVSGALGDPTLGATHYHSCQIMPGWARKRRPSAQIGTHLFYNDVE